LIARSRAGEPLAKHSEAAPLRQDQLQHLELLRVEFGGKDADPGDVAAGPCQAGDEFAVDEVVGDHHDRDRAGRLLRRAGRRIAGGNDNGWPLRDQRFGKLRQPLGVALGKPGFEADITAVDLSQRRQGGAELRRHRLDGVRRVDAQHRDQRQRRPVLRQRRNGGAQPQRNESCDTPHPITSSRT